MNAFYWMPNIGLVTQTNKQAEIIMHKSLLLMLTFALMTRAVLAADDPTDPEEQFVYTTALFQGNSVPRQRGLEVLGKITMFDSMEKVKTAKARAQEYLKQD